MILQQASPVEIAEMLLQGEADIGIATESLTTEENLASIPYYQWQHSIITPQDHPLTQLDKIDLDALSEYPPILITAVLQVVQRSIKHLKMHKLMPIL